ncbi:MAG: phosphate acetyltransferase, partial [Bacteroidales bacterium]|nr:phosphate acetyltransferase [Bacteroidales bacterium]
MNIIQQIIARAKASPQRIVLPEGTEERTLAAADRLIAERIVNVSLIGNRDEIFALADKLNLTHVAEATIVDPLAHDKKDEYAQLLYNLRKNKGMTLEQAYEKVEDPLYLGCLMIKNGDADGEVAGARNTTGNVLRPAMQIIKTLPG